ncbi:MAG: hypothetical protein U0519_01745 [Candidatus Gracilibacteria bacterium]
MAGEYIQSDTIESYWKELKGIYKDRAEDWKDLTEHEYATIERSEREDSDNHLNEERLGKDTQVIDVCKYKFLPERKIAYHVKLIHANGSNMDVYFQITLKEGIAIN